MLSAQEISRLRSPDMWRVNRMTPGLGLLAKHPDCTQNPSMSAIACYRQLLAREDLVLTFLLRQLLESLDDDVASHEQGLERIGVDEIADRTLDRGLI